MEIALRGDYPHEIAGLVNVVKKAYMDEIVNLDAKRRADRVAKLKVIKDRYEETLSERRKTLRKRSETAASDDRLRISGLERPELLRLQHDLWMQRIDLQLERADAKARLAERKKAAGAANEAVRTEIERIEDQLVGLMAQEKFLDDRLEQMAGEIRKAAVREAECEQLKAQIASIEDVDRKLAAEIGAMNIELEAPPRVRTIEDAVVPTSRFRTSLWGSVASNP